MSLLFSPLLFPIVLATAVALSLVLYRRYMERPRDSWKRVIDMAAHRAFARVFFALLLYMAVGIISGLMSGLAVLTTMLSVYGIWLALRVKTNEHNEEADAIELEDFEKTLLDDLVAGGETMRTLPDDRLAELHEHALEELKRRAEQQTS